MSFDIRLVSGDVVLGGNGDVDQVIDSNKLAQDVIKLLNTTLGTDPFNPGYGSTLTASSIGTTPDPNDVILRTQAIITQGLNQLIAIQNLQRSRQYVSDAETILDFDTPTVQQDAYDPRQYNIQVNAVSKALTPLTLTFVIQF
jgi:N-methylhydantoinase A/oxoprolinase/acetone carboxylase beta subunit